VTVSPYRIRWSHPAEQDIERIFDFIAHDSASMALRVVRRLREHAATLKSLPNRGRPGVEVNTREIVIPNWPYIVVYRVMEQHVEILQIRHAKQQYPPPPAP
jgi:toxin ParE1/3/4